MINTNNNLRLVIDDGGMIMSNPDDTGFKIRFDVYERILDLAKKHEIKIPIACTASFFDIDKKHEKSKVNPYVDKIIRIINDNPSYLELWNHGLTHMYEGVYTEFLLYSKASISEDIQKMKIEKSQEIFHNIGFKPTIFVPPGHGWERGVTDKICKEFGIKTIAAREFEKTSRKVWWKNPTKRYKCQWEESEYLNTIFRLGLGIKHDQFEFNKRAFLKTKHYILNDFPFNIVINRKLKPIKPIDHFFAHIQNFVSSASLEYFNFVIKQIKVLNSKGDKFN